MAGGGTRLPQSHNDLHYGLQLIFCVHGVISWPVLLLTKRVTAPPMELAKTIQQDISHNYMSYSDYVPTNNQNKSNEKCGIWLVKLSSIISSDLRLDYYPNLTLTVRSALDYYLLHYTKWQKSF